MKKKIIALALCICLLAVAIVGGTMAYFTDNEAQSNTFTSGQVGLSLNEAVVEENADGDLVAKGNERTAEAQTYHLYPAQTVTKDPTITLDATSEDAYVAAVVTVSGDIHSLIGVPGYDNIDITKMASGGLMAAPATQVFGWNGLSMVYETADCVIYQSAAKATNTWTLYIFLKDVQSAGDTTVLFDTLTMDENWDNEEMALLNGMQINVNAYAVQAHGFDSCFEAMTAAFDGTFAF